MVGKSRAYKNTYEAKNMEAKHSLASMFLKRPSQSTLTQFAKADLVDLGVHLGWSKTEKLPKKAELRSIVKRLAVSAKLLEVIQPWVAPTVPEFFGVFLSVYATREGKGINRERETTVYIRTRMRAKVASERERVKVEQLNLELIRGKSS